MPSRQSHRGGLWCAEAMCEELPWPGHNHAQFVQFAAQDPQQKKGLMRLTPCTSLMICDAVFCVGISHPTVENDLKVMLKILLLPVLGTDCH